MASPSHPFSPAALWEVALSVFPPFRHVSDDPSPIRPSFAGSLSPFPALFPFPALSACAPSHGGLFRALVPSHGGARVDPALGPDAQKKNNSQLFSNTNTGTQLSLNGQPFLYNTHILVHIYFVTLHFSFMLKALWKK